ncbi:MAG: hypothetical protein KAG99_04905 [Bacteroidales bacterium]|nr:hypothetical protein [Bacteroidales bacterium]
MPKRTLAIELHSFFSYLKEKINKVIDISASAFTQSRQKLSPDIFVRMNQVLLQEYYTDNQERAQIISHRWEPGNTAIFREIKGRIWRD